MGTSQTQANSDLNADYGAGSPATIYAALSTAAPNYSGNGTITEPTTAQYNGYARVAITNNATNFPNASAGGKTNGTAITFPASTGGASSPVTVLYLCFVTTAGGGYTLIDAIAIPGGASIGSGTAPSFPASSVTISEA